VATSKPNAHTGTFTVPARTTAVFIAPGFPWQDVSGGQRHQF
jgi:hypothetical protein